jgi:hypothetical protein
VSSVQAGGPYKNGTDVIRGREARWDEVLKNHEEQNYAEEQLDNKNDVKSR